jgi:hypothetical protein
MLRIVVLALLLIVGGTSFNSSPAQAQRPAFPTQAFTPCWTVLLPACPPGRLLVCYNRIACSYFGQQGSLCTEWRCQIPGLRLRGR